MLVGVPRECKVQEYRVGLTPTSVRELVAHGHGVVVETGAGDGIGAGDSDYRQAGAQIVATPAEVFARADPGIWSPICRAWCRAPRPMRSTT